MRRAEIGEFVFGQQERSRRLEGLQVEVPQRTSTELAAAVLVHITTSGKPRIAVVGQLHDDPPVDERVDVDVVGVGFVDRRTGIEQLFDVVDVFGDVLTLLGAQYLLIGFLDVDRQVAVRCAEFVDFVVITVEFQQITARYGVAVGVFGLHLGNVHAVRIDTNLFAQQVTAPVFAVEDHLHETAVGRPRQGGAAADFEGRAVAHQRAVAGVGEQHPPFVLFHSQHGILLGEFYGVGLFGKPPRVVAASLGLHVDSKRRVVRLLRVEDDPPREPFLLRGDRHAAVGEDRDDRKSGACTVFQPDGELFVLAVGGIEPIDDRSGEIVGCNAALLLLAGDGHSLRNGVERRFQLRKIGLVVFDRSVPDSLLVGREGNLAIDAFVDIGRYFERFDFQFVDGDYYRRRRRGLGIVSTPPR